MSKALYLSLDPKAYRNLYPKTLKSFEDWIVRRSRETSVSQEGFSEEHFKEQIESVIRSEDYLDAVLQYNARTLLDFLDDMDIALSITYDKTTKRFTVYNAINQLSTTHDSRYSAEQTGFADAFKQLETQLS